MPDPTASTLPASENVTNELTYDCPVCDNIDSGAPSTLSRANRNKAQRQMPDAKMGFFYSNHFLAVFDGATDIASSRESKGKRADVSPAISSPGFSGNYLLTQAKRTSSKRSTNPTSCSTDGMPAWILWATHTGDRQQR